RYPLHDEVNFQGAVRAAKGDYRSLEIMEHYALRTLAEDRRGKKDYGQWQQKNNNTMSAIDLDACASLIEKAQTLLSNYVLSGNRTVTL
ncbi:hypothetical protein, partial [Pseudomonas sp. RTS4]